MPVITEEMFPATERAPVRPRSLPSLSMPRLAPTRAALLCLLSIAIAFAPEPWLRAFCAVAAGLLVYVAGIRDGRADLAVDALLRGVVRPPVRTPREGPDEEGG